MDDQDPPKITYLFGAGASALALPTVKQLPDRINTIKDFIEQNYIYDDEDNLALAPTTFKSNEAKSFIIQGLENLYKASQNHSTIDTYAKTLYLRGRSDEIDQLVFFLALYFNYEQKISGTDPRYDTFLVSILQQSSHRFPRNLKFLSWNYDLQIEAAYERILGKATSDLSFELFNTPLIDLTSDYFSSIKLNGSCNLNHRNRQMHPLVKNIHTKETNKEDIEFALKYSYINLKKGLGEYPGFSNIKFAWDKDEEVIENTVKAYAKTQILVVIGYSFPFFNREVDRKIIRNMTTLRKIYIQDCRPKNIEARFLSILPDWKEKNIDIISVDDVDEFFLPPEL